MLKTRKAASTRFRMTKSGKFKMSHSGKRHLATGKSRARKRKLKKAGYVSKAFERNIRRYMPYG